MTTGLEKYCDDCVSKDVCKYTEDFKSVTIESLCPYAIVVCSRYTPFSKKRTHLVDLRTIVRNWRMANPRGRKIQCARDTGISRPTIDKYWNCLGDSDETNN